MTRHLIDWIVAADSLICGARERLATTDDAAAS
jgi:hypothetical protein